MRRLHFSAATDGNQRKNGKKHLTFGHGIHACIGRELARMEIRIVLREFLLRTENMRIGGDAPFIDFESTWSVYDVGAMDRYLPVQFIKPKLRQWL